MPGQNIVSSLITRIVKALFSVNEKDPPNLAEIKRVLVVRQHNQFGDLLACVSLFRAIKENIPDCKLTVITSPQNFYAITKNKYVDEQFVFDKGKAADIQYLYKFINILRTGYDLAVVPVTVAVSDTSCFIARAARAKYRIGPASLDGKQNQYAFLFNNRVQLNWIDNPDRHVSDFGLDILRPLGISTDNYKSEISFDRNDEKAADEFLNQIAGSEKVKIIGLHIGAGKPPNRWDVSNFVKLSELINKNYKVKFYLTGSSSDENELSEFISLTQFPCGIYKNKTIPELAALISKSDLFITNDTGVMHVAGATETPQVSLFGPTNYENWAPPGENKTAIKKSESINDISVEEVYNHVQKYLNL